MRFYIAIPLIFAAGMATVVLLQIGGLIQLSSPFAQQNASTQSGSGQSASGVGGLLVASDQASSDGQSQDTANALAEQQSLAAKMTEQIDDLKKQVQQATVDRDVLRSEIETLSELVDTTDANNAFLPDGESSGEATANTGALENNPFRGRGRFGRPDSEEQYQALISAGIDPSVAQQIKQRDDQWTLQRLELIDQATREGWRGSDEFDDRLDELREERPDVRSELGDSDYDQYLFESGESNRVQVSSIIDGSAAQISGMQTGDRVLSYANQLVFNTRELQNATREGTRGESVAVTVERNGQQLSLELPRGPLGVTLTGLRVDPDDF